MSRYFRAEIKENRPVDKSYNILDLKPLKPSREPEPGQFYMIGIGGEYDPLLKRPFSVFRKNSDGFQILYRIKGRGTLLMRDMKEGVVIDVLGPLGNSYPLPDKGQIPLIVAGGIGIASVFSLAEKLRGESYMFYGARNRDELLMLNELKGLAEELFISTDDGSFGRKGTIADVLNDFLTHPSPVMQAKACSYSIYACGPKPMLKAVSRIAIDKGLNGYVCLEENMACGVGACFGCVVKTKEGYRRVCKEGPVFSIEEIVW